VDTVCADHQISRRRLPVFEFGANTVFVLTDADAAMVELDRVASKRIRQEPLKLRSVDLVLGTPIRALSGLTATLPSKRPSTER
jgi:hypothetical protein